MEEREAVPGARGNRRFRILLLVGFLIAMLAALLVIGYRSYDRNVNFLLTHDSVLVLSMTLTKFFQENPQAKSEEIEAFMLQSASAAGCDLRVDPAGRPVDRFGTPFRVERTLVGKEWVVTVTSAGPDRLFGTSDDIKETTGN